MVHFQCISELALATGTTSNSLQARPSRPYILKRVPKSLLLPGAGLQRRRTWSCLASPRSRRTEPWRRPLKAASRADHLRRWNRHNRHRRRRCHRCRSRPLRQRTGAPVAAVWCPRSSLAALQAPVQVPVKPPVKPPIKPPVKTWLRSCLRRARLRKRHSQARSRLCCLPATSHHSHRQPHSCSDSRRRRTRSCPREGADTATASAASAMLPSLPPPRTPAAVAGVAAAAAATTVYMGSRAQRQFPWRHRCWCRRLPLTRTGLVTAACQRISRA